MTTVASHGAGEIAEPAVYEEFQDTPLRGPLTILSGAAFFVSPLFTSMPLLLVLAMFACGIGMSIFIGSFTRMYTRVTPTQLSFGPRLWTRRFALRDVEIEGPRQIPFMAGIGIHKYRGAIYYNMRLGEGLAVRCNKRLYVVGSEKVQHFQMALETAKRSDVR
ncbi:MAG: hypothetical protein H6506_02540 [Calditrichaeota bacterium]|nr:hypothetical protein [Calditrichota bacterium]MCB9391511.1 hypothetical protein [Calditrichota bacterium]